MKIKTNKIILDAYNANPTSIKAALDSFVDLKDEPKIAIFGDMFELGQDTDKEHQAIAEYATSLNIDTIYLAGKNFYASTFNSPKINQSKTFDDLKKALKTQNITNSSILIKGSRGMALERVLDLL